MNDMALVQVLHYVEELEPLPLSHDSLLERLAGSGFITFPTRSSENIPTLEPLAPSSPSLSEILDNRR
jgi:hypothetical protein